MKKPSKLARSGSTWGLAMVAPTIIGLLILNIVPFFQTIYMSFSKTKAFGAYEFCGFANYMEMFQTPEFWKATWNSVYFCILTVPIGVFLSLLVAVLLNAKIKGKTVFRAIYFLPMVVAPAAVAMVWKWIFNTEYGIINTLFGANVRWLTDPNVVMITCAIVAIWSAIGYDAVLLLSGIQNISKSLYEAAGLDGASKVRQFFTITLPMVSPTLFVVLIMRLMASLKVYDLIYMMVEQTNPALTSAQSLMYLFYRESFIAGNKGYASAIVIWTVLLIGLVTIVQFIGQKKWVNYEVQVMKQNLSSQQNLSKALVYAALIAGSITMIFPFAWMLLTSFKTQAESMAIPPQIFPAQWNFDNFIKALQSLPFWNLYINTFLLIFFRVICAVVFSSMAGYAFAKLEFPCKNLLFGLVLMQMMLPSQIFIIPQYQMLAKMGLTNTIFALVFPGLVSAFGTFFLRQAYMGIPNEIAEAAYLDGCTKWQTFTKVLLPLTKSSIAALAIFTAVFAYADLMWPLICNTDLNMMTLSAGLSTLNGQYTTNFPVLMAGSLLAMIPMVILYLLFQKQFIEGIAMTGGK